MAFLSEHMVTKQELQQELQHLRDELPNREDFALLQTSVDGIAKRFKDTEEELAVTSARTSRMEAWIQKAANIIGVEYRP